MRPRRVSLHGMVALSLAGMGVLALALVLLSARIYRDLAYENQASALQERVAQQVRARSAELAADQQRFALRLAADRQFREAWAAQSGAALAGPLADAVAAARGGDPGLPLRRVRLLDAGGGRLHAAGPATDSATCPGVSAALDAGPVERVRRWSCIESDQPLQAVLVPLPGLEPAGYIEVVADPVARLGGIADDPALALRIERPGGAVLFESPDWGALAGAPHALSTRHLTPARDDAPVLAVRAATRGGLLHRQLADTRDFVLLAAALIVAAAVLVVLVVLRRVLQPLRALEAAAQRLSRDAGPRPDFSDFSPVPEAGPAEIATPIHSFNRMVERISTLLRELETEVEQRREAERAATAARELAEGHARRASEEKEFTQITLESVVDAVIATDTAGRIEYMNPIAEDLTGVEDADARGRPLDRVVHLYEVEGEAPVTGLVEAALADGRRRQRQVRRLIDRDGQRLYVEYAASAMRDAAGEPIGVVVVFHDVTQAQLLTERLTYQATHDALTGLINRYEFERRIQRAVERARAGDGNGVLCYLDLDQFKLVNDTCGHVAGDELLRQLAMMLTDHVGTRGTLARLGGDEFGLLMHPATLAEAEDMAEELRHAIACFRFAWEQSIFTIGVSAGLVEVTGASRSTDLVLSAADTACYMAKDSGRNRIQVYRTGDSALLERHAEMHWVSEINRALEQDRFRLYCQDIIATRGAGAPCHYEILLRMEDDDGRIWLPGAFLSAAERYNLATAVDQWVIRHAFAWIGRNAVHGEALYAINLSGCSLADETFLTFVLGELEASGVDPRTVCFEVTETAAISNLAAARTLMETLRRRGCRFSLDDFGSGLSSFTYLKNLPVDFLKIDGSFVRDIHLDSVHYAIVRSMNDVGQAMRMATIAEFVESPAVMECLREIGVDLVQGFQYSRPRPLQAPPPELEATGE